MTRRRGKKSSATGCLGTLLIIGVAAVVIKFGAALVVIAGVVGGAALVLWIASKIASRPAPAELDDRAPEQRASAPPEPRSDVRSVASDPLVPSTAVFRGWGTAVRVAGRELRDPMTYIASTSRNADASTIITNLAVGNARRATPMPYWPSYAEATPDQRALYLDWMAGGRVDSTVPISYPFIFFYGLERRALIDRQDTELCRGEVVRLLDLFGSQSGSFRGYATRFLVFLIFAEWSLLDERGLRTVIGVDLGSIDEVALAAALGWYHEHQQPLPPDIAALAASCMENAKRGVVIQRAQAELLELFGIRYRERLGDGLIVQSGKHPRVFEYHPASGTLLRLAAKPRATIPDVLARRAQFKGLVEIWNSCVDDLRRLSTKKTGAPDRLTREVWESMPPELRAQVDHPDLDRWLEVVNAAPRVGSAHLLTAGKLASLTALPESEKITAAQGKKLAQTAAMLGFAIEPELRISSRALEWESPLAVWRTNDSEPPDASVYVPASTLLALLLSIVLADGEVDDRELGVVTTLVEDTFMLDEMMRQRLSALREILLRVPAKSNAIAKRLRETKTRDQLQAVGRMLVAVAAADGVLADGELKSLKAIFRALGLTADDLDAQLVSTRLRLAKDEPVPIGGPAKQDRGETIPPPSEEAGGIALDQDAINRIMAETHEVAAILADVLDRDDTNGAARSTQPATSSPDQPATEPASSTSSLGPIARTLDLKYHALVTELICRNEWSEAEAKALARKHRLLSGAIVEAVNAWSEDELGDALISEGERWSVNTTLVERLRA